MCVRCDGLLGRDGALAAGLARRSVLRGIGGAVGAGALAGGLAAAPAQAAKPSLPKRGLSVVLLGTKGGPPVDVDRCGIASAVVVDQAVYVVDAGRAAATQYLLAGLRWADLAGVFITHLHADHIADYFNLFMLGGHAPPTLMDTLPDSTPVYGPGPAGGLPPTFGGSDSPTTNPANPTPGLLALTDYCANAYAYSTNVFMRDSRIRETRSLLDVREIALPAVGASYQNTAPSMPPFVVLEDDRVRVSAVLVPHGPAFPSFAYRFDTDHGSVTFSGDTTYSDNLLALAHRSDLLVHEAINVQGFAGPPALIDHLLQSHVEIQQVGKVAQRADVRRLALSHLGDFAADRLDPRKWKAWAQQGYDGRVHVGDDLDVLRIR